MKFHFRFDKINSVINQKFIKKYKVIESKAQSRQRLLTNILDNAVRIIKYH